ncbi:MAG: hypothetical protein AAF609_01415 [Cyanobacteria bacterium P01_C01_bin.120]
MKGSTLLPALIIGLCLNTVPGSSSSSWAQSEQPPTSETVPETLETSETPGATLQTPVPNLSQRLPMGTLHIDGRTAAIPDWQVVSFDAFPPFSADGQWGDVAWSQGDLLADVMTLGDFQGSLDLHLLTIASIAEAMGMPAELGRKSPIYLISLNEFELLERQTIASLVAAVPSLLEVPVEKLPLVQDLVRSVHPTVRFETETLETLLLAYPDFGEIKLSQLILEDYQVGDLPGIERVPLQSFAHWQEAAISEVPMLPVMSWWLFPQPPQTDGEIAVASIQPLTDAGEAEETYVLALTPRTAFEPVEWVIGEEEAVANAGLQARSQINEGQELKGALPFGPVFKVVPESITPEGVQVSMYFRTCRQSGQLDCSGYGIGPIPLQTYRPGETVFLGEYAFPVTPLPSTPAVTPHESAPSEPVADILDVVIEVAAENKGQIGTVAMIFTLLGGVLWWAWKGDPVQFFVLTFRWMMATQIYRHTRRLTEKPGPSTEPSDAEKS